MKRFLLARLRVASYATNLPNFTLIPAPLQAFW